MQFSAPLRLCVRINLEKGRFQGKPEAEGRANDPQHAGKEAELVGKRTKLIGKKSELIGKLAKPRLTPSETEKMFTELSRMRAKPMLRVTEPIGKHSEPIGKLPKQRSKLPEQFSKLPKHRFTQSCDLPNAPRAPESFPRARQWESELPAKPPKPVSRQPEPR